VSPFTARSPDGRSEWQIVRDLIATYSLKPGDILPYHDLHVALNRDEEERQAVQRAAREASRHMLQLDKRCLVPVPNEGYRLALPSEHVRVAKEREARGVRQFARAIKVYDGTPLDELKPAERELHLNTSMLAKTAFAALDDHEKRLRRLENVIGGIAGPKIIDHDPEEIV
jgi:hypothetical protein